MSLIFRNGSNGAAGMQMEIILKVLMTNIFSGWKIGKPPFNTCKFQKMKQIPGDMLERKQTMHYICVTYTPFPLSIMKVQVCNEPSGKCDFFHCDESTIRKWFLQKIFIVLVPCC